MITSSCCVGMLALFHGDFQQTGHVACSSSHGLTHLWWNKCLHSGNNRSKSSLPQLARQMEQQSALVPLYLGLASQQGSLGQVSTVASSNPKTVILPSTTGTKWSELLTPGCGFYSQIILLIMMTIMTITMKQRCQWH